jgi:two-component system, chemotaxis family, chemotaxis protein CheY
MSRTALVIDDSRAQRTLLARLLGDLDFDVVGVPDGRAALEALSTQGPFELALVDWTMPEMDGLSFIRTVRSDPTHERLLLVMVTSESEPTHIARALMAGADEYVVKPATAEALQAKLALAGLEVGC